MRFFIPFLFLIPTTALAQDFTTTIDVDLNGDGLLDHAKLSETPKGGAADLTIFLRQPDETLRQEVVAKSLVWVGAEGEEPLLSVHKNSALRIDSVDRLNPRKFWQQTLTVTLHNGKFVLAGFSYNWYDTGEETIYFCNADLLSGSIERGQRANGILDGVGLHTDAKAVPIDTWIQSFPQVCEPRSF